MNEPPIAKSPNRLSIHTDWSRYDSPAVLRKHGPEFLERLWVQSLGQTLASELAKIAERCRADFQASDDQLILSFDSPEQALACARRLRRFREVEALRVQLTVQRRIGP